MEDSIGKNELKEKEPKSVEISMGTLFTVKSNGKETDRVDIITDIGEGDYFYASRLKEDENGKKYFGFGGTAGPENFGRKVGQMEPKEVIKAAKLGAEKTGYVFSKRELDILKESAKKGSRTISLS